MCFLTSNVSIILDLTYVILCDVCFIRKTYYIMSMVHDKLLYIKLWKLSDICHIRISEPQQQPPSFEGNIGKSPQMPTLQDYPP